MKTNTRKDMVLKLNATAFLKEHDIQFEPDTEFEVIPNKGKIYRKKLDDMTVRELLLSGHTTLGNNGLEYLIYKSPRKGHNKIIEIFGNLLRQLVD